MTGRYEVHAAPMGQLLAVCDTLAEAVVRCDEEAAAGVECYIVDTTREFGDDGGDDGFLILDGTTIR